MLAITVELSVSVTWSTLASGAGLGSCIGAVPGTLPGTSAGRWALVGSTATLSIAMANIATFIIDRSSFIGTTSAGLGDGLGPDHPGLPQVRFVGQSNNARFSMSAVESKPFCEIHPHVKL